ncbi:amblin-like [Rhipicephalus microplus]|uniref:amblin-like n=1 Tax=Rhipicephalus microplus TaxID=6941 RepID=UPI003F6B0EFA
MNALRCTIVFLAFTACVKALACLPTNKNGSSPDLTKSYEKIPGYCYEPLHLRPCHPLYEAWYYDYISELCKRANPNVCGAGKNLFNSKRDCLKVCANPSKRTPKFCSRPPVFGSCDPVLQTWRYDHWSGYCKRLNYTICNLGVEEFSTEEACVIVCKRRRKPKIVCSLTPRSAPCTFLRSRWWYFDFGRNFCFHFPVDKCAYNDNGFSSKQKCLERCSYHTRHANQIPW